MKEILKRIPLAILAFCNIAFVIGITPPKIIQWISDMKCIWLDILISAGSIIGAAAFLREYRIKKRALAEYYFKQTKNK